MFKKLSKTEEIMSKLKIKSKKLDIKKVIAMNEKMEKIHQEYLARSRNNITPDNIYMDI